MQCGMLERYCATTRIMGTSQFEGIGLHGLGVYKGMADDVRKMAAIFDPRARHSVYEASIAPIEKELGRVLLT